MACSNVSASEDVMTFADYMRRHPELWANPLFWTSHHMELMGCQFQHVYDVSSMQDIHEDSPRKRQKRQKCHEKPSDEEWLARSFSIPGKLEAITNILLSKGSVFNKSSKGPSFYFADRDVHQPLYTVFSRRKQPDQGVCQDPLPLIGYLNYTTVIGPRTHQFLPRSKGGGVDYPLTPLGKKKYARVIPKEWKEDPYFVFVLLSIAQLQEDRLKELKSISHLSRLLVASPFDRESIHLYQAHITSDFLRMLDKPTSTRFQKDFPTIEHREISFKPYETLRQRILDELSVANMPPHLSNRHDNISNKNVKRAHEQKDKGRFKRTRSS
ncbi:hypothetical protein FE257_012335 [Aspergillus nanangensis]|uniref:Uncharacterized protein n=1 Tax=Aspergillus nanangensis TaxID=2582783 RepID=A0AAD4CGK5_ASPNN|nr:hypothetical protein FE257_012335 [Aspergillus nanangensis]